LFSKLVVLQTSSGGKLNVFRSGPGYMILTVHLFDSMDSVIKNFQPHSGYRRQNTNPIEMNTDTDRTIKLGHPFKRTI